MPGITLGSPIWAEKTDMSRQHQNNPEAVSSFLHEAAELCQTLYQTYDGWQLKFHRDDRSASKAVWMLDIECVCTLAEARDLLEQQKHRSAGKLMRHALEAVDLSSLFLAEGDSGRNLREWYSNRVITHKRYREHLRKSSQLAKANERKKVYDLLSQWTHHTYYTVSNSFTLGAGDRLVHDAAMVRGKQTTVLITRETIYQYCWLLSVVILAATHELRDHGFMSDELTIVIGTTD